MLLLREVPRVSLKPPLEKVPVVSVASTVAEITSLLTALIAKMIHLTLDLSLIRIPSLVILAEPLEIPANQLLSRAERKSMLGLAKMEMETFSNGVGVVNGTKRKGVGQMEIELISLTNIVVGVLQQMLLSKILLLVLLPIVLPKHHPRILEGLQLSLLIPSPSPLL